MRRARRERAQAGFTILELMIVVGVIGVLASLTANDFSAWRRHQQLKEITREAYHTLAIARTEAVRGQQGVTVTLDPSGLWAFIDSNGNHTYDSGSDIEIYKGKLGNESDYRQHMKFQISDFNWVHFNSKGYSVDASGDPRPVKIGTTDQHPTIASTRTLVLGVSYSGALRIGY